MSAQLDFAGTKPRKLTTTKAQATVLTRCDKLIEWFTQNRPSVRHITLSASDYDGLHKDLPPGVFLAGGGAELSRLSPEAGGLA